MIASGAHHAHHLHGGVASTCCNPAHDLAALPSLLTQPSLAGPAASPLGPAQVHQIAPWSQHDQLSDLVQQLQQLKTVQNAMLLLDLCSASQATSLHKPLCVPSISSGDADALRLVLALQQQQQAAALLARVNTAVLAGIDLLGASPTSSPESSPKKHKSRRGGRGRGRGKKCVTTRAPTWAGTDWSPKQAVLGDTEGGTGVFIPGVPASFCQSTSSCNSDCSMEQRSDPGSNAWPQERWVQPMQLPERPWY